MASITQKKKEKLNKERRNAINGVWIKWYEYERKEKWVLFNDHENERIIGFINDQKSSILSGTFIIDKERRNKFRLIRKIIGPISKIKEYKCELFDFNYKIKMCEDKMFSDKSSVLELETKEISPDDYTQLIQMKWEQHDDDSNKQNQPMLKLISSSIDSYGIMAMEDIVANRFIMCYLGEYIDDKTADIRESIYQKQGYGDYFFRIKHNIIVDGTKQGNLARFINHSCSPNCYTRIIHTDDDKDKIVIFSKRFIKKGEELTYDYKFEIELDISKKIICKCGSQFCRQTIN